MKVKNTKKFIPMYYFISGNTYTKEGFDIVTFWDKLLMNRDLEFYECLHNDFKIVTLRNSNFPYNIQYSVKYCKNCGLIEEENIIKEIHGTIAYKI